MRSGPLLAARGFAVPGKPGLRLRTLADVFAYAEAEGVKLRFDGGPDRGAMAVADTRALNRSTSRALPSLSG